MLENHDVIESLRDIESKLDAKRQALASLEQEILTFRKAKVAEQYAVEQLIKQKKDLEEQVVTFSQNLSEKEKLLDERKKELSEAEDSLKEVLTNKEAHIVELDNRSKELKEVSIELESRESALKSSLESYEKNKSTFDIYKEEFLDKAGKIKNLCSELCI